MINKQIANVLAFLIKSRWIVLIIIFIVAASFFSMNEQFIVDKLDSLGVFAPILFLLLYCLLSILCLPTILLVLAGGALFGPVVGTLLNLFGATLGAACGFSISRYLRSDEYVLVGNKWIQQLIGRVESHGWKSVALLRLTPAVPYNLVNYGLGLTRIKFSHYILATVTFLIPNKIFFTYCGYSGVMLSGNENFIHFMQKLVTF